MEACSDLELDAFFEVLLRGKVFRTIEDIWNHGLTGRMLSDSDAVVID